MIILIFNQREWCYKLVQEILSFANAKHFCMKYVCAAFKNVILKAFLVHRSYTAKVVGQNWTTEGGAVCGHFIM